MDDLTVLVPRQRRSDMLTFSCWVANEGTLRGVLIMFLAHDQLVR